MDWMDCGKRGMLWHPISVAMLVSLASCYTAEIRSDIADVYACDGDSDCAVGNLCIDAVCTEPDEEDAGPSIRIASPAPLEIFRVGEALEVPLTIAGSNLILTAGENTDQAVGFLELTLDGEPIATVADGDLAEGISLPALPLPTTAGLHHLRLEARGLDGEVFDNPESETHVAFWVDDGEEHVGMLEPIPGARVAVGDDQFITVEVVSLNFTFVNPGFISPADEEIEQQGYLHFYVDADVPNCLPGCNFDYQTSLIPAGPSRLNRMTSEHGIALPDDIGTVRLQVVAQTATHEPYYRNSGSGDLVYHASSVQSVVEVEL